MTLDELRAALDNLAGLSGLERARAARALARPAGQVVAAAGDAGVYEATRAASYDEVAQALGVSYANVNRAVTRHLRSEVA